MKRHRITISGVTLLLLCGGIPAAAQNTKEEKELKLNDEAVRMIQFDFSAQPDDKAPRMLEAPIDKSWMKFKKDLSMPRSLTDSTRVKSPEAWIRPEPYTIWTKFGENPVYDVLPNPHKEWKIYWTLNPFRPALDENYGHSLPASPGPMYDRISNGMGSGGSAVISADINGFLYDVLTPRGRMLAHNRKHANAWKTYENYIPTAADSAKFPTYFRKEGIVLSRSDSIAADSTFAAANSYTSSGIDMSEAPVLHNQFPVQPLLPVYRTGEQDSTASARQKAPAKTETGKKPQEKQDKKEPEEGVSRFTYYIRQRMAEDSIRRQQQLRREQERGLQNSVYDLEKQIRQYKEKQN